jgi:hypothetical protein
VRIKKIKEEDNTCKNQTPFKFLDYLENSNFRSDSKKDVKKHPELATELTIQIS